jgi:uncharacterized membrane-anchored protein
MNKRKLFSFVVILQICTLLLIAGSYYLIDIFGKEIRLKTEPIDPTDLFYGDYVVMQYDVQTLSKGLWKGDKPIDEYEVVYVVLDESEGLYEATGISPEKPQVSDDEIVMKGRYIYNFNNNEVYLTYGIERYYIKEGTGKELEDQRGNLVVSVLVAPWGQKKISEVIIQSE